MNGILDLISKTADGVCAVDRKQRIVHWNDAAEALTGFKAREALGKCCNEIFAGRDVSGCLVCHAHCPKMGMALNQKMIATQDLLVRTKAGRDAWLSVSTIVAPTAWQDQFVLVRLFRDASRQKENDRFVQQLLSIVPKLSLSRGTEPPTHSPPSPSSVGLTGREQEVLRLLASGGSNNAIAKQLFISPSTARNHIHNILAKFGVHSRLEAVTLAIRNGLN